LRQEVLALLSEGVEIPKGSRDGERGRPSMDIDKKQQKY